MIKRVKLPKEVLEFFRETGRAGGHRRAANLSAKERSEQARKAVRARWAKRATQTRKKKGKK
jgi:ParB-like chromosome segregation protein Spo0J